MIITEDLILTPPLWTDASKGMLAYGPFVVERGSDRLVGMYLTQPEEGIVSIYDGARQRFFREADITLRGMQVKDAAYVDLDPKRIGLTKEDVITKALLMFQPKSV